MKNTFRSGCITLAYITLLVTSASASKMEETKMQWYHQLRNTLIVQQKPAKSLLRNTTVSKLRLDSMVIQGVGSEAEMSASDQKTVYHYNAYGQIILTEIFDQIDGSGNMLMSERTTNAYDARGFMKSDTTYELDTETDQLFARKILDYRFDAKGVKLMENCRSKSCEACTWQGDYGDEFVYDAKGRLAVKISNNLTDSDTWTAGRKMEYSYDANGFLITETEYYQDTYRKQWTGLTRLEHSLDSLHRDTTVLTYFFYPLDNVWSLGNRDQLTYDADGHLIRRDITNWSNNQWSLNGKYEYIYDTNGNRILEIHSGWSTGTKEWVPSYREEWSFDNKGNLLTQTHFEELGDNHQWTYSVQSSYQYDMNLRSEEVVWPFKPGEFDMPFINVLCSGKLSMRVAETDTLIDFAKINLFYSPMDVLGVKSISSSTPPWLYNPTTRSLTFGASVSTSTMQLYDLQGRLVLSRQVSGNSSIPLNECSKGLYLIRLNKGKVVIQGMMMVK